MSEGYFTVRVAPGFTPWRHPTEHITRGTFQSVDEADRWVRRTLGCRSRRDEILRVEPDGTATPVDW